MASTTFAEPLKHNQSRLRAQLPAPQFVAEPVVMRSHIHVQSGAAGGWADS